MPVSLRSKSIRNETKSFSPEKKIKKEPENVEVKVKTTRNVEEIRRKNLEENKAFLESLLMTKIRDDFKTMSNNLQSNVKKESKKRDLKCVSIREAVPIRRSERIANLGGEKVKELNDQENETISSRTQKRPKISLEVLTEDEEKMNEQLKIIFQTEPVFDEKKSSLETENLRIFDENVFRLTADRLTFIDVHSRSDQLAIAGCDKNGTVGVVVKSTNELEGNWSKITFKFHERFGTCCRFDPFQHSLLHSTSYDTTMRNYDLTKNVSNEIFVDPEGNFLTGFDDISPGVFLVSEGNGDVLRLDTRIQPVENFDRFNVSSRRICSVHLNPTDPNEFCISGTESGVKIFDLRKMSSIKYFLNSGSSCYGAYYNLSGSRILATTREDSLSIFSIDEIDKCQDPLNVPSAKRVSHQNYVHRFVKPFIGQPHGLVESHFLIGTNKNPRCVEVLDENCCVVGRLTSENLNSLASINVSHRTLPIIVTGNSGGRVHVFTN